jgi:excisionase family DNA binding protein
VSEKSVIIEKKSSLPLLVPFTQDEFIEMLRSVVREELQVMLRGMPQAAVSKDEPLLTREEVAAYLRISLVTLTDWVKRGLPSLSNRGRVVFLKSEVLAWLKENRTPRE